MYIYLFTHISFWRCTRQKRIIRNFPQGLYGVYIYICFIYRARERDIYIYVCMYYMYIYIWKVKGLGSEASYLMCIYIWFLSQYMSSRIRTQIILWSSARFQAHAMLHFPVHVPAQNTTDNQPEPLYMLHIDMYIYRRTSSRRRQLPWPHKI